MTKDIQREIRNIISEIEEKSADGNYIYRGERSALQIPHSVARSHQVFGDNFNQLLPVMIRLSLITT